MKRFLLLTTAGVFAVTTFFPASAAEGDAAAPYAAPPGAMLKEVTLGEFLNVPGSNFNRPPEYLVFADSERRTLYISTKDKPGESTCYDACAEAWKPFVAPAGAQAVGGWSIVNRADGVSQWAFHDKPLYTYAEEEKVPERGYSRVGANAAGHGVDGHEIYEIKPQDWMVLPMGIEVREVRTAPGQVLTNEDGLPLYSFDGNPDDRNIGKDWIPFQASQLSLPLGDFTVISRSDGISQWAYKGKPLFTYAGDMDYGDSHGQFADSRFGISYVMKYFMPDNVEIVKNHLYGGLLVTTDNKTLYTRELGQDGVDYATRGDRGSYNTGKNIGTSGCDSKCEETWKPLLAPQDAVPRGYWSVYDREDGSKQWAYYGYALYTLAGEEPGLMSGNLQYDTVNDSGVAKLDSQQVDFGMRWRVAPP
jgi:predicted lipoprotein with Yx(FWY)xxD motif